MDILSLATELLAQPAVIAVIVFAIVLAGLNARMHRRRDGGKVKKTTGGWTPVDFKAPVPKPYPDWDVKTTKPLPYRPFRYGPKYFITMGLRKMDLDEWIELDSDFPYFHATKASRIASRGSKCCRTAPSAYPAAIEFLTLLFEYLPARYPTLYCTTRRGIRNLLTGEEFDIVSRPLAEDPMQMAARTIQDDLAIMMPGEDGKYYFLAGAILLPGFWRLEDKFGMDLGEIHTSGKVPGFEEKLRKGMENFFGRVQPGTPVLRNNYFIQVDDNLAWSTSIGSEDDNEIGWFTADAKKTIENHHFRSERQSLRRLPKTGGVVFTIRTYMIPISELVKEPYVPGRLASAIRSWGNDVATYKGREKYGDVLLEYLDRMHQKQVEEGLEVEKEEMGYPF